MKDDNKSFDMIFKIILIGDSGVGKTNLIAVATGQKYNCNSLVTTTCSYMQIKLKINNTEYIVNLWDTMGQEKYKSMTKIFFKNSKIVLYVYDITKRKTFDSLNNWKDIIDNTLGDVHVTGVVANKCDLYVSEEVKEEEGKKYADDIGAKFIYTSAKIHANNFKEFLKEMVEYYVNKYGFKNDNEIDLNKKQLNKNMDQNGKKCC
jgi:Ras-related protein Rab-1A